MMPIDSVRPAPLIAEPKRAERTERVRRRERRREENESDHRRKPAADDDESSRDKKLKGTRVDVVG